MEGIRAGQSHIFTHGFYCDKVRAIFDDIVAAFLDDEPT
jgi:hypothetical protein